LDNDSAAGKGQKSDVIVFVSGHVHQVGSGFVDVNVQGVGYRVYIPDRLAHTLQPNAPVFLYTYHHIREDAQQLFGFATPEDRDWFELLLGVSGIGPKGALQIISACSYSDFLQAVLREDAAALGGLPGVGKKTAQRLIIELKDKLRASGDALDGTDAVPSASGQPDPANDVIEALTTLGYTEREALSVYLDVISEAKDRPLEELIRLCLQRLARV
jgi:Holliday junction DNA helicase RuvA